MDAPREPTIAQTWCIALATWVHFTSQVDTRRFLLIEISILFFLGLVLACSRLLQSYTFETRARCIAVRSDT